MNILATADENDLYLGKVEELITIPVAAFTLYHAWLCGKRFTADTNWMESYDTLFHLHPLSHPLHDIEFRDAIFDGIIDKFNSGADNIYSCFLPSHATVHLVYANIDKPHPLRKFVARMYAKRAHRKYMMADFLHNSWRIYLTTFWAMERRNTSTATKRLRSFELGRI